MAASKFVPRLSNRLHSLAFKLHKKPCLAPELSSIKLNSPSSVSVSSRANSRFSRLPHELSCVETMLPLHSAIASSRLVSSLSIESETWTLVPQGVLMPL